MENLKVSQMIGYQSPAKHMKPNVIEKLIGAKISRYDDLMPKTESKAQQEADFKLKLDKHINPQPYDMQDEPRDTDEEIIREMARRDRAYSYVDKIVPGYSKAGKLRHKIGAALGMKSSKKALAKARRAHLVRHGFNVAGEATSHMRPEVDPNLIKLGAGLGAMATNKGISEGEKYLAKRKAKKAETDLSKSLK